MNQLTYRQRIEQKLSAAFCPIHLEITDDSARHKGHAGSNAMGETHFKVRIESAAFQGLPPVARHRLIYNVLTDELKERVHALNIQAIAPGEYTTHG